MQMHVQTYDIIFARARINVKIARAIIEEIFNMAKNYGESEQKEDKRYSSLRRRGLGSTRGQSQSNGDEIKNRTTKEDCTRIRRDKKSSINRGKASLGKILSQLRELQRSHLAYIESHEERLQIRLKAAQEHHAQILDQMKLLEQEVLCLLGEGETI
jgi:hypothetical protein